MISLYPILDVFVTATETFSLCLVSSCFLKKPRFQHNISLALPAIVCFLTAFIATWFTEIGAIKMYIVIGLAFLSLRSCYRDSALSIIAALEVWFISLIVLPERMIFVLSTWFLNGDILLSGAGMLKHELYMFNILIHIVVIILVFAFLKDFQYTIRLSDLVVLTLDFLFVLSIFFISVYSFLNVDATILSTLDGISMVASFAFLIHFLYSKNMFHLRKQEEEDKLLISQLNQQYTYYKDKLTEETRIRSIYHDMKNHLLVLESMPGSETTHQMITDLRTQIEDYENYIHTGNEFLDVIIREKVKVARDKGIDINVLIHFEDATFLEILDISTIFGNALDNAIEASEKLPRDQRLITVKADRIRDMIVVAVRNNTLPDTHEPTRTTKKDTFLHGFGLPNIRNTAEKYGGQCSTQVENGTFALNLILPIP